MQTNQVNEGILTADEYVIGHFTFPTDSTTTVIQYSWEAIKENP